MKTIGIQRLSYNEERNIYTLNRDRSVFRVISSNFSTIPQPLIDRLQASSFFNTCVACPAADQTIDCYHFFNSLPLNWVPFVCTFESSVPRWWGVDDESWRLGLDILMSPSCRQLFAMSRNAIDLMRFSLARYGERIAEHIMQKVTLVYPPQALPKTPNREKFDEEAIRIAFVGADFLRKGGYEFLCAAAKLLREGANIRVHIVSTLVPRPEDFPWNKGPDDKIAEARAIIGSFPEKISYSARLVNSDVVRLFSDCHVAALPSFHDTFGYSVLEAQSNLCAVITTNQRAFPEINPEQGGWTISLPIDQLGQISYRTADFPDLSDKLHRGILATLTQVINGGMNKIREKAEAAFHRVREINDPQQAEHTIFQYY